MKQVTALFIPADEKQPMRVVKLPDRDNWDHLRQYVGGYIEFAYRAPHFEVVSNEEARILNPPLPPNARVNRLIGPAAEQYVPQMSIHRVDENLVPTEAIYQHVFADQPKGLVCGNALLISPPLPIPGEDGAYEDERIVDLDERLLVHIESKLESHIERGQ